MVGVKRFLFKVSLISLFSATTFAAPTSVSIGLVPIEGTANNQAQIEEFVQQLEKRTGLTITTYAASDYADLVQKLNEKKVDFAFLSALTFVESEAKIGLKVLLKKVWEQGFYYSVWLAKSQSKLRKISDLKGKRIAFVDEKSASGYLYPQISFMEAGLSLKTDFKSVAFSGGHEKSAALLQNGQVDAIAVFSNDRTGRDSAWSHAKGQSKDVRVLWASAAIPNDPFCVRQDFYERHPKATHDLMFALIEMDEDAATSPSLRKLLGVSALMLATSQQYEPVREMFRKLKSKKDQSDERK